MTNRYLLFVGFFMFFLTFSCQKSLSEEDQLQEDIRLIKEYVEKHKLEATQTESGLFYVIENLGNGNHPKSNSVVRVRYKGYTLDGKQFDASSADGIEFGLQNVISGWQEGIPKFKEGGSGILLIPSYLAYGQKGSGPIAPNSVLIFDVDLLSIVD